MSVLTLLEQDCSAEAAQLIISVATDYLADTRDREGRVSTAATPAQIAERFAEPMPQDSRPLEEIAERLRTQVIPDCNRLYHPRYVGHQVSAPLPAAVWTESLTAALNQSVAVWEMSPVATMMEHQVVRWMCDLARYGAGSGGTLTSGGTEATFTALLAARCAALPDSWSDGVVADGKVPLLVCGEHAHYAVTRAAGQLGLGLKNVVAVRSRDRKMDPDALREVLENAAREKRGVMAVIATSGSTATGSFDDLDAIGTVCDEHGVWLHVDGAHGASALLSHRHRHRMHGVEHARTIAWDPHKMMLLPLQCGMLLARNERDLDAAFSQSAPYLFHGGEGERSIDQGVRSFLCSRRADVLKLWVALQRYGADGIGEIFDHLCDTARAMYDAVVEHPEFEALHTPEANILCFRYVGTHGADAAKLDGINRELRERYNRSGEGWITATNLDGRRVLRVTVMNPRTTASDVVDVLNGLAKVGRIVEAG